MMYLYLYCTGRPALMHDPPQRLEACLRFLALLAVTPFPPSPWVSSGYPTLTFTKDLRTRSNHQIAAGYVRDPRTSLAQRTLAGVSIVNRALKWTRQHLIIVEVVTVWTRRCTLASIEMSSAIGNARDFCPERSEFES